MAAGVRGRERPPTLLPAYPAANGLKTTAGPLRLPDSGTAGSSFAAPTAFWNRFQGLPSAFLKGIGESSTVRATLRGHEERLNYAGWAQPSTPVSG